MNREEFRNAIVPLSDMEQTLKREGRSNSVINPSIPEHYTQNGEGYYFLTNKEMTGLWMENYNLRSLLKNPVLGNKLRLIIHCRYSKIPMHSDEFISINYVYAGHLTVEFPSGETKVLESGQFYLMNTHIVHAFEVKGEEDLIFGIQIQREFLSKELLFGLSGNGAVVEFLLKTMLGQESEFSYLIADYRNDDRMKNLFEDLFCEYLDLSVCSDKLAEDYMKIFFILLMRSDTSQIKTNTKADVLRILEYINQNYTDCSLGILAEKFHFSEKYLSRLIREKTGMSFMEILTDARMNAASYCLLHTDLSVREIAVQCGYTNQSFFYKKFNEKFGMSPKEYRESLRTKK